MLFSLEVARWIETDICTERRLCIT